MYFLTRHVPPIPVASQLRLMPLVVDIMHGRDPNDEMSPQLLAKRLK